MVCCALIYILAAYAAFSLALLVVWIAVMIPMGKDGALWRERGAAVFNSDAFSAWMICMSRWRRLAFDDRVRNS